MRDPTTRRRDPAVPDRFPRPTWTTCRRACPTLGKRLRPTRRSATGPVPPGWEYGVPVSYVKGLVERWLTDYDWREWEAKLNEYPQYTTTIDGQNVHFLHVRSPEPDALPLILSHGWPNSVVEFLGLIGPLYDPRVHGGEAADAFHLVIPHLPGFGFSGQTTEPGWDSQRIARAWAALMRRLGYDRYGAHGNDTEAIDAPLQGRIDPDGVVGVRQPDLLLPLRRPGRVRGAVSARHGYLGFLQDFVGRSVHDKCNRPSRRPSPTRWPTRPPVRSPGAANSRRRLKSRRDTDQRLDISPGHQHRGVGGPHLLRGRPRGTADGADHGAHWPGELRQRLQADPRFAERDHENTSPGASRPRRPLGRPRRPRSPRRRHRQFFRGLR